MLCREYVIEYRHGLPQTNVLECARYAELCDPVGRGIQNLFMQILVGVAAAVVFCGFARRVCAEDRLSHEGNASVGRLIYAGDAVKRRRFARTVRPDERNDLSLVNFKGQVAHGNDSAKLHGDVFHAKNILTHGRPPPLPLFSYAHDLQDGTDRGKTAKQPPRKTHFLPLCRGGRKERSA